jgi:hypothetical protein
MNKWIMSAAISTALPFASPAQTSNAFQYVVTSSGPGGGIVTLNNFATFRDKVVTGRPFSGTEEHHTLQVLGDGTRIENKSNDKYYRDDQGRTRVEREDGTVLMDDPVLGTSSETGRSLKMQADAKSVAVNRAKTFSFTTSGAASGGDAVRTEKLTAEAMAKLAKVKAANGESHKEEDLGFQIVNGVSAQGTRITTTIPAGQIGNDRPIDIVSENWYSPDLQMLIRSSNKDPRFGETTYNLTIISQTPPDPSLFQTSAK